MHKLPLYFVAALFIFTSARINATPLTFAEEAKLHIIVIDHKGAPLDPEITRSVENGKPKYKVTCRKFPDKPSDPRNYRIYVENILAHIAEGKTNRIMFFIHGG